MRCTRAIVSDRLRELIQLPVHRPKVRNHTRDHRNLHGQYESQGNAPSTTSYRLRAALAVVVGGARRLQWRQVHSLMLPESRAEMSTSECSSGTTCTTTAPSSPPSVRQTPEVLEGRTRRLVRRLNGGHLRERYDPRWHRIAARQSPMPVPRVAKYDQVLPAQRTPRACWKDTVDASQTPGDRRTGHATVGAVRQESPVDPRTLPRSLMGNTMLDWRGLTPRESPDPGERPWKR